MILLVTHLAYYIRVVLLLVLPEVTLWLQSFIVLLEWEGLR